MRCASVTALLCAAALFVGGCAAPPKKSVKRPAAKPVATASKARAKTAAPAKTAARPAPAPAAPRSPQDRYAAALELMRASRWAEAEAALAAYVRDYPQYSGPRTNLGIVYARTNRKPQAIAEFNKAIAANPKNAAAHTWLGVLAREAGDHRRAEAAYKQALAAQPDFPEALLNLAILYDQHLNRPRDALTAYKRYRDHAGKDDVRAAVWVAELENRLKLTVSTK